MFACLERQVVCSFELNSRMWVLLRNIPKLIHDSTESRVSSRTSASLEEQFMDPKYDMQETSQYYLNVIRRRLGKMLVNNCMHINGSK